MYAWLKKIGAALDFTAAAAKTGGTPEQFADGRAVFPVSDVVLGGRGTYQANTVHKIEVTKDASVFAIGDLVWWDSSGTAKVAGDSADFLLGVALEAAATGDATVIVDQNAVRQGLRRPVLAATKNVTLTGAMSGTTFRADAADIVFSLPAAKEGMEFTFVIGADGLSTGTGLSISPQAADGIIIGGDGTVDKDLIAAGASDAIGDAVTLRAIANGGASCWAIISQIGSSWAQES